MNSNIVQRSQNCASPIFDYNIEMAGLGMWLGLGGINRQEGRFRVCICPGQVDHASPVDVNSDICCI